MTGMDKASAILNRRRPLNRKVRDSVEAYIMILPIIIGLLAFTVIPFIASLLISFTQWDIITPSKWVGIENYVNLFKDEIFLKALKNTGYYAVVMVPLATVVGFFVALMLNMKIQGTVFFRTIYYLPAVTSTVAVATVWLWLFNRDFGLINYVLSFLGIQGPAWLSSEALAMPAIIIFSMWQGNGYTMLLYLAALQGIPQGLYESAYMDGAGPWQRTWRITIPMVSPTTFFLVITGVINSLQVFEQCYILTGGGPYYSTTTISFLIYNQAFSFYRMGYASAISWILFLIIAVVTIIQFRFQNKLVFSEE